MKRVSLLLAVVLLLSVLPLGASAAGTQLAFTQQPQDCTAMPGRDTAVFSVQAVGDPAPTYQWQLKKSDTWENLFLVTQPTYTISRVYTTAEESLLKAAIVNASTMVDNEFFFSPSCIF